MILGEVVCQGMFCMIQGWSWFITLSLFKIDVEYTKCNKNGIRDHEYVIILYY